MSKMYEILIPQFKYIPLKFLGLFRATREFQLNLLHHLKSRQTILNIYKLTNKSVLRFKYK